jgi:hypothetical protein
VEGIWDSNVGYWEQHEGCTGEFGNKYSKYLTFKAYRINLSNKMQRRHMGTLGTT